MLWIAISPRAPVPKSNQPRHDRGSTPGCKAARARPPARGSSPVPAAPAAFRWAARGPASTICPADRSSSESRGPAPIAPAWIHSRVKRRPSPACPLLPICVTRPGFFGHAGHFAGLFDAVRHGLFHVHVLSGPQCRQRDGGVHVIGRGDHHRVDVLALLQHDAVIFEPLGLRDRSGPCAAAYFPSTSHKATMFSPAISLRSPSPCPPTPMPAILSFSLVALVPRSAQLRSGARCES